MNAEVETVAATIAKIVLMNPNNTAVFTSSIDEPYEHDPQYREKMAAAWPQVLREAFDADITGKQIAFYHRPMHNIDFAGLDLSDVTFLGCSFVDSNLRQVSLMGANLANCDFGRARMQGADVTGANLHGASFVGVEASMISGLIMLGELDGYFVYAYRHNDGKVLRIRAGCRDFTLARARAHWEDEDNRRAIYASLDLIEHLAKSYGWALEAVDDEDDE